MHLTGTLGRATTAPCVTKQHDSRVCPVLAVSRHVQRQRTSLPSAKQASRSAPLCRANGDTLQTASDHSKRSIDLEPQAEGEYCMPGEVTFDNEEHEQFTIMKVEVKDYPGLLRVIAWVLNGLQLVVQNARYCAYLP